MEKIRENHVSINLFEEVKFLYCANKSEESVSRWLLDSVRSLQNSLGMAHGVYELKFNLIEEQSYALIRSTLK